MSNIVQTDAEITEELAHRIIEAVDPLKIILFGSRARGDARPDSDFDILVIQESSKPRHRRSALLYTVLADLPMEVEIMVYTPQEVLQWSAVPEAFITTAVREGQVLYERSNGSDSRMA
jgi:uncharacterized protein